MGASPSCLLYPLDPPPHLPELSWLRETCFLGWQDGLGPCCSCPVPDFGADISPRSPDSFLWELETSVWAAWVLSATWLITVSRLCQWTELGNRYKKERPCELFSCQTQMTGCCCFFNLITLIIFVFFLYKYTIAYWLCVCFKITVTLLTILLFLKAVSNFFVVFLFFENIYPQSRYF